MPYVVIPNITKYNWILNILKAVLNILFHSYKLSRKSSVVKFKSSFCSSTTLLNSADIGLDGAADGLDDVAVNIAVDVLAVFPVGLAVTLFETFGSKLKRLNKHKLDPIWLREISLNMSICVIASLCWG